MRISSPGCSDRPGSSFTNTPNVLLTTFTWPTRSASGSLATGSLGGAGGVGGATTGTEIPLWEISTDWSTWSVFGSRNSTSTFSGGTSGRKNSPGLSGSVTTVFAWIRSFAALLTTFRRRPPGTDSTLTGGSFTAGAASAGGTGFTGAGASTTGAG